MAIERPRIRLLRTHEEYHAAERIQKIVWRYSDREIIPLTEMVVAQKIGGMVIGAFVGKRMIGFCFGVPGFRDGEVFHHSRMLGVLPEYQDSGIGMRMKLFQRAFVRRQGIGVIQWTFDPLQSRNANLNIAKLGCIVRRYLVNVYGANSSIFNAGLETDRVIAEWRTENRESRTKNQEGNWEPGELRTMNRTTLNKRGFREIVAVARAVGRGPVAVEIPGNVDALKQSSLPRARAWRRAIRSMLQGLFRKGYIITSFRAVMDRGERRCFYRLERGTA